MAGGEVGDADAEVIRIEGGHVYPGLQDAHAHLGGLGASLVNVDLVDTRSLDEVIARVVARAKVTPKGDWILGRGWDQNDWEDKVFPAHEALSAAVPDHPVWVSRIDGHAAFGNAAAMKIAEVNADTESPDGGEILRKDGENTGVFIDAAMSLVWAHVPAPSESQVEAQLLAAQAAATAAGLTCVHDAGMGESTLAVVRKLHVRGDWNLRVYAMLPAREEDAIRRGPWQTPDGLLVVRAVKGYADGALGSRGAALIEPYADRSSSRGLMITRKPVLERLAKLCAKSGFQLCVHAIGDRANRDVLEAYAAVPFASEAARRAARFRIEHAQIVHPDDFAKYQSLHVIPSMQPTHLTSDMPWARERIGDDRVLGAYAWKSFHALGLPVAFGSDFPVESVDPRLGLWAAITTRGAPGAVDEGPEAGFRPEQNLDRAAALRGFTMDAAYAMFAERELGTLESGKLADFTVFDRDLLTCPVTELLTAKVLLTVVGGRVAFRAEGG